MKRSGPLRRAKPLTSSTSLSRRAQPAGQAASALPQPRRPQRQRTGPTQSRRDTVLDRDDRRCVMCGRSVFGIPHSLHHRCNRKMGGRKGVARDGHNSPANLVTLCGTGTTGCHGAVTNPQVGMRAVYERNGFVLREGQDPAAVPVRSWAGWMILSHDGHAACL